MTHIFQKIIFVQSAGFAYREFELSGNTHFSGKNSTGKSLIMDAIALCWGVPGNYQHLLNTSNSAIAAQWSVHKKIFTTAIYPAPGNSPNILFISGEYEKEIFINQQHPRTFEEVIQQVRKRKLSFHKINVQPGDYLREIQAIALKENPDAGIFQSRTLHRLIADFQQPGPSALAGLTTMLARESTRKNPVDFAPIHHLLKDFFTDIENVQAWEKQKPRVSEIRQELDRIAKYELRKKEVSTLIQRSANQALLQQEKLENQITKVLSDSVTCADRLQKLEKQYATSLSETETEISSIKGLIRLAEEKAKYYQQPAQQALISNLKKIPLSKSKLKTKKLELEVLAGSSPEKNELFLQQIENEQQQNRLELEAQKLQLEKEAFENIRLLRLQHESKQAADLEKWQKRIAHHMNNLSALRLKFRQLSETLINPGEKPISHLQSGSLKRMAELEESQFQLAEELQKVRHIQASLESRKQAELNQVEQEYQQACQNIEAEINHIHEEIGQVSSQIANRQGSLFQWLQKNYPDWEKSIGKVLKEEVLFHPYLSPEIQRINDLLFGVKIDLDEISFDIPDVRDLELTISGLTEKKQVLQKDLAALGESKPAKIAAIHKKYQQKSRQTKREDIRLSYQFDQVKTELNLLRQRIAFQSSAYLYSSHQESVKLLYNIQEIAGKIRQEENESENLQEEIKSLLSGSDSMIATEIGICEENLRKQLESITGDFQKRHQEIEDSKKAAKKGQSANSPKGTLKKISEEIDELEEFISQYPHAEETLWRYRIDKADYICALPELQNSLSAKEITLSQLKQRFATEKQEIHDSLSDLQETQTQLEINREFLNQSLSAYAQLSNNEDFSNTTQAPETTEDTSSESLEILIRRYREVSHALDRSVSNLRQALSSFLLPFNIDQLGIELADQVEKLQQTAAEILDWEASGKMTGYENHLSEKYGEMLHKIVRTAMSLRQNFKTLKSNIQEINALISYSRTPDHLPAFSLELSSANHPIVEILLKLETLVSANSLNLGSISLFNQPNASTINQQAWALLKQLYGVIRDFPRKEIAFSDLMEIMVTSPEKTPMNAHLPYIIHTVRIAFVKLIREQEKWEGKSIPLIISRSESLDQEALEYLMDFANQHDVYLITSSPESRLGERVSMNHSLDIQEKPALVANHTL